MDIETYGRYQKSELGVTEEQWTALGQYTETIHTALEREVTDIGGVSEVEENPPSVDGEVFTPGGWVGLYPGDVTVVPSHLSETEYETILAQTQKWIEIIGAATIETSLPLSTDILIDARTLLAAYSKAVIEATEVAQSQRLPVKVKHEQHQGLSPKGRPLFGETIREAARGTQQVVSEEVRFTFDTVLNHLLVRFHIELLAEMSELADEFQYYATAFSSQIQYHEQFVNTGIPSQLIDQAIQTDFSDPSVIAEARRDATNEMAEIVDLWEAFQRDIAMELTISNQLHTAVKPISKLYELWCLGILLEILTELTGEPPDGSDTITTMYQFDQTVTLHYNRSMGTFSQYLNPNLGVPRGPGRPDFALEVNGEIVWVGDAKFKQGIRAADYRRFLPYVIDLLSPERSSAMLYIAQEPKGRAYVRDYPIDHISLRPDAIESGRGQIREFFSQFGIGKSS